MKILKRILFLLPLSLLIACSTGNVDVDNAGEEALKVTIDGQLYLLKAGARENLKLDPGLHSIQIADIKNEVLKDTAIQILEGGLINVARGEYLIWKDVFSPQATLAFRKQALEPQKLTINKKVFEVDYEMLPDNRLFIEKKWDYGLTESFPKKVYGWEIDKDKKFMIKTKLVRLDEFERTYMEILAP